MKVTDDAIRSWRLSIDAANIRLGEFNWPLILGAALDEIEGLRASLTAVEGRIEAGLAWARQANPDPARNGDLFRELRSALAGPSR